jgi:hypothetical protein
MKHKFLTFILLSILAGCAEPTIYYWQGYDDQVYGYFKDKPPSELIVVMEQIKEKSLTQEKPLPPSFYAHLGLLYQKVGQTRKFKALLEDEKAAFPEGSAYANFLLKGIR